MKPKLRFKEFDEDWEEKKLGEMFDNISDKKHPELPVLSVTQDKGTIYRDNLEIDIKFDKQSLSTYKKVLPGQFIISLRSFQGGLELSELEGIVSPAYTILNSNTIVDKYFWKFYFKTYNFIQLLKRTTSGIRDGKQISYTDFKTIKSSFPSLPEQEKIGQFFSLLDDRIEKQEQKINLLKERKKGWMQKLFNQEIRFKDENGDYYPDWEEKKLEEISVKIKAGGTPKTTTKEFYNGDIPFLTISDMTDNGKYIRVVNKSITNQGLESSSAWKLPKNNLLLSMYASIGKIAKNLSSLTFSQAIVGIILDDEESQEYIYQYLNYLSLISYYDKYVSEGTQKNLNIKKVKNIEILLPSLPEQEKIAGLLSKQDELIEKEEEKLSLLKEQKKGLLQQMFV